MHAALGSFLLLTALLRFVGSFDAELGRLLDILAFVGAIWLSTFVHELGHAVAGILCGWKVDIFAAGPVGYHFANRKSAWIPGSKRQEVEGFVLAVPTGARVWTRARDAALIAGGPAASLVLAFVCIYLGFKGTHAIDTGSVDWARLTSGFGLISLATALHTLLPHWNGDRTTDGQKLVRVLRTDDLTWRKTRALAWLYALVKYQVRLRELPRWMLDEAEIEARQAEPALRQAFEALVIGIVLDSPPVDRTDARNRLDAFRRKYGSSAWLDSCDAYFTAVWEGDAVEARQRLWNGAGDEDMRPMILAADAAVSAREGDSRMARILLAQMRDAVRKRSIFPDLTFRDI
jgi:hypothetical protein